ncbi:MAG TPA: VOC family protein [Clostridia bacterium]|nr:VOC family protein [Clostridia bacterium]
MARVTGIGGIFIKARDAAGLAAWYTQHLGIAMKPGEGAAFFWPDDPQTDGGMSVFSAFPQDSKYFDPSPSQFMINFRVDDLDALLAKLESGRVAIDPKREEAEYGRFAWIYDPAGNKVELWEPPKTKK